MKRSRKLSRSGWRGRPKISILVELTVCQKNVTNTLNSVGVVLKNKVKYVTFLFFFVVELQNFLNAPRKYIAPLVSNWHFSHQNATNCSKPAKVSLSWTWHQHHYCTTLTQSDDVTRRKGCWVPWQRSTLQCMGFYVLLQHTVAETLHVNICTCYYQLQGVAEKCYTRRQNWILQQSKVYFTHFCGNNQLEHHRHQITTCAPLYSYFIFELVCPFDNRMISG